ncbi:fumarylacetoacetate (FAA) hydrolase family protein [Arthrobacter sp. W4I7]|nr:hypothetical protein [Arthrobacter sp. W4I7]MDQ0693238.1 fumarylacetoacetate (FAA) hydrolase family protein [Arthrobacter sp. W4I7]
MGNDANLRDVEGRSALLLCMAKDNNASCAIGPLIRLFHEDFTLESLRTEEITLTVEGTDGYRLEGRNSLARISSPQLGALINRTQKTEDMEPWTFGTTAFFNYLTELETWDSPSRAVNRRDSHVSP